MTLSKIVNCTKPTSYSRSLATISLFVSALIFTPTVSYAAYSTGNPVNDNLLNIAQEKLDAEYDVLIKGNPQALDAATTKITGKAKEKVKEITELQLQRNKSLNDHKQKYIKSVSWLCKRLILKMTTRH